MSFGYYNEDCKVIVIAPVRDAYIVCVYGLSTNSWKIIRTNIWNTIQTEVDYEIYVNDKGKYCRVKETKFLDGTVYVIEYDYVRCFDLSSEIIRVVSFLKEFRHLVYYYDTNRYKKKEVYTR